MKLREGRVIAVCQKHHDEMTGKARLKIEDMKFRCSICDKVIKNKDGQYIKFDKDRSIKVCKMHVPDKKANSQEIESYKFVGNKK